MFLDYVLAKQSLAQDDQFARDAREPTRHLGAGGIARVGPVHGGARVLPWPALRHVGETLRQLWILRQEGAAAALRPRRAARGLRGQAAAVVLRCGPTPARPSGSVSERPRARHAVVGERGLAGASVG